MQNDVNNAYLRKSAEVLQIDVEKLKIVQLSNLLPYLTPALIYIFHVHLVLIRFLSNLFPFVATCFEELAPFWIVKRVQEVVDLRTASDSVKRMDLLQLMLDASHGEESQVIITPSSIYQVDSYSLVTRLPAENVQRCDRCTRMKLWATSFSSWSLVTKRHPRHSPRAPIF